MGLPDTSPRFSLLLDTPGLQIKELGLGEVGRWPWALGAGGSSVLLRTLGHRCCGLLFPGQPSSPWAPYGSKGHPDSASCSTADGPGRSFLVAAARVPGQKGLGRDTLLGTLLLCCRSPCTTPWALCSYKSTEKSHQASQQLKVTREGMSSPLLGETKELLTLLGGSLWNTGVSLASL